MCFTHNHGELRHYGRHGRSGLEISRKENINPCPVADFEAAETDISEGF
jgi:hypothetical protein